MNSTYNFSLSKPLYKVRSLRRTLFLLRSYSNCQHVPSISTVKDPLFLWSYLLPLVNKDHVSKDDVPNPLGQYGCNTDRDISLLPCYDLQKFSLTVWYRNLIDPDYPCKTNSYVMTPVNRSQKTFSFRFLLLIKIFYHQSCMRFSKP